MAELLIEILTEELPALSITKNLAMIENTWQDILKENRLSSHATFFFTPRRLVLIHEDFPLKQEDSFIESFGPPLSICFDSNNSPTKAMQSFLKKNNISADEAKRANKDNKEVLYHGKTIQGLESINLLGDMAKQWLSRLHFGKSMRWGTCEQSFIRPIRNICVLLDSNIVPMSAYNLVSNDITLSHRQAKNISSKISNLQQYKDFLYKNGVVLDPAVRKDIILKGIAHIESTHNLQVATDNALLQEVIAITEYPSVLLGHFDKKFLEIPKEMIIASMRDNQRYFALHKNGALYNGFVVVSNAFNDEFNNASFNRDTFFDLIIRGNEKVLKARLSDALFFYKNDLESNMHFGNLANIGFMQGGGNMDDKVQREIALIDTLLNVIPRNDSIASLLKNIDSIKTALQIAKNDLMSKSVGEFPELQGIMGSYFAKEAGYNTDICLAIREQYLPHGLDSSLPSSFFSAFINMVIKLDSIFMLFSLNKIPSGSKDPFALRRATASVLRICHAFNMDINIESLCSLAYDGVDKSILKDFISDRVYGIFSSINPSIVRSVLVMGFGIKESFDKIQALAQYLGNANIKSVIGTFKRVANILESTSTEEPKIDASLCESAELGLYNNLMAHRAKKAEFSNYITQLENLFTLKTDLDVVFDKVLINTQDETLRNNRISLVRLVFNEFLAFGDMREISTI